MELLTLIREEVSVLVAKHTRKKPITAPRPRWVEQARKAAQSPGQGSAAAATTSGPTGYARAQAVLMATSKPSTSRRRVPGEVRAR